jgi:protein-S-isoprenylcysteine O-methyltransferase Ste14
MKLLTTLKRAIRPSTTRSTSALWAKSLLNAVLFFGIFMILLPWLTHTLLPRELPFPSILRIWIAGLLAIGGVTAWVTCLDTFSRKGRGTPLPADAPRKLVTTGLFRHVRNPIMAGEIAVIWAEALYFASLGITLYAAAISLLAHVMVVHVEEPELRDRFGDSFTEYCRTVPRWFPRFRRKTQVRPTTSP